MWIPPTCPALNVVVLRCRYAMAFLLTALLPDTHPPSTRAAASVLLVRGHRGWTNLAMEGA
jgi:hypothetical protein